MKGRNMLVRPYLGRVKPRCLEVVVLYTGVMIWVDNLNLLGGRLAGR